MTNSTTRAEKGAELDDIETVLGTHAYTGRVYSPKKVAAVMNVDVITGEHTHEIPPAAEIEQWIVHVNEQSRQKAEITAWHTHTPHVALVADSGEHLYESGALLSHAAVFHRDVTGGLETHTAYTAADNSDEYTVDHTPDYEQGTVTITVEPVAEADQ